MENELTKLNNALKAAGKVKTCCNEFKALKSDEERFEYTLRLLQKFEFEPKIEIERKCASKSLSYRKQGNNLYVSATSSDKRDATLELYTKSVAFALPNSIELAYSYGNRSALLFSARLYGHCLRDIDRALRIISGTEDTGPFLSKILSRRERCLEALRKNKSNRHEKTTRVEIAENPSLRKENRGSLASTNVADVAGPTRFMFDEEIFKPRTPTDNRELPGVSAALEVSYDETFGRHVTATRNIRPGEVLAVQKGYATILAPERFHTHCSNCLRQTWSAVPCERCPLAVYCDETCRDEARRDHHDVECGVVSAMLNMGLTLLDLMSLRLAIRAVRDAGGFENLRLKLARVEAWPDPRTKGYDDERMILDETDYSSVYTLARNTEKRSEPDLFGRSFNSVYIVYYVAKLTDFFGETFGCDLGTVTSNYWIPFFGGLITTHQQIIPSNVHAVMETMGLSGRERGASLIPFLSLFNHSCDPMVTRVHYGTDVVLYALRNIAAGDQVYDNYGMHYALEPRISRQLRLQKQYFFTCQCLPCEKDWPLFDEIPNLASGGCKRNPSWRVDKILEDFYKYVDIARNSEIVDKPFVINDVVKILETLYENVELPCREVNEVVETLKRLYGLLSARFQSISDVD